MTDSRLATESGQVLTTPLSDSRIAAVSAQVLRELPKDVRSTQLLVEALATSPDVRTSQLVAEALALSDANVRATQLIVESMSLTPAPALDEDFTGADEDPWPSDQWTTETPPGGGAAVIISNRGRLRGNAGNAGSGGRAIGKSGQAANQIYSGTLQLVALDEPCVTSAWVQTSEDWASEDYPTNGYGLRLPADSDTAELVVVSGGVITQLATATWDRDLLVKRWKLVRIGNRVEARVWNDGDPEPDVPLMSVQDSTLASGGIGGVQLAYYCDTAPVGDGGSDFDDVFAGEADLNSSVFVTRQAVQVLTSISGDLRVSRQAVQALVLDTANGPDAAPSGLTATGTSGTDVELAWTDNATDETGYIVQRRLGNGSWVTLDDALAADTTSYTDPAPADGAYTYRVAAVKDGVRSTWAEATITLGDTGASNRIGGSGAIRRSPRVVRR